MELVVRVILAIANGSGLRWQYIAVVATAVCALAGIVFVLMGSCFWTGVVYGVVVCLVVYVALSVICGIWSEFS
jgi:hypothetical protein